MNTPPPQSDIEFVAVACPSVSDALRLIERMNSEVLAKRGHPLTKAETVQLLSEKIALLSLALQVNTTAPVTSQFLKSIVQLVEGSEDHAQQAAH